MITRNKNQSMWNSEKKWVARAPFVIGYGRSSIRNSSFVIMVATLLLVSCDIKDPIYESPPVSGALVTVSANWSATDPGIEKPATYNLKLNDGEAISVPTAGYTFPDLFEAGIYRLQAWNTAEHITVSGTTATVTQSDGVVNPLPGWLFTSAQDITVTSEKEQDFTAAMRQQVRRLTIELTVTEGDPERIARTEASLSGVAGSMDFGADTYAGSGLTVEPEFTRDGDKLTAVVRLVGITTEEQTLTLTLHYTDGSRETIVSDVSDKMLGFNTGKQLPMLLEANLHLPVEAGFTAIITDWKQVTGGSGIAN